MPTMTREKHTFKYFFRMFYGKHFAVAEGDAPLPASSISVWQSCVN